MVSAFYGLEIAKSALFASRYQMNTAGHNLANEDTPGYTRQRLVTSSIPPFSGKTFANGASRATQPGGGVKSNYITQIRDVFVDRQYRNETSQYGYADTLYQEYSWIGTTFLNEIEQNKVTSLSAALNGFYNAVDQVSNTPTSLELRTNLVASAKTICSTSDYYYTKLKDQYDDLNETVDIGVKRVNQIAGEISKLSGMIFEYELSGAQANDLRDRRNMLLDELSDYSSISYTESEDTNDFTVYLGSAKTPDNMLVKGSSPANIRTLETVKNGDYKLPDPNNPTPNLVHNVYWKDKIDPADPTKGAIAFESGSLKASIELRDGTNPQVRSIPDIVNDVNKLLQKLAIDINTAHIKGYTLPIDGVGSINGQYIFAMNGNQSGTATDIAADAGEINMSNFKVTDNLIKDPRYFAASSEQIDYSAGSAQAGNNKNALEMLELYKQSSTGGVDNFDSVLRSIVSNISSSGEQLKNNATSQKIRLSQVSDQRLSISSVSSDEEFTEIIKFSKAFNAAARLLTTMDEQLDILVNKLGIVGR